MGEIKEEIPHYIGCEKIEKFSPGNLYVDESRSLFTIKDNYDPEAENIYLQTGKTVRMNMKGEELGLFIIISIWISP